jgi:hypothetical protein
MTAGARFLHAARPPALNYLRGRSSRKRGVEALKPRHLARNYQVESLPC